MRGHAIARVCARENICQNIRYHIEYHARLRDATDSYTRWVRDVDVARAKHDIQLLTFPRTFLSPFVPLPSCARNPLLYTAPHYAAFASASKSRMCVHSYSSCSAVEFTVPVLYLSFSVSLPRFPESRRCATKLGVRGWPKYFSCSVRIIRRVHNATKTIAKRRIKRNSVIGRSRSRRNYAGRAMRKTDAIVRMNHVTDSEVFPPTSVAVVMLQALKICSKKRMALSFNLVLLLPLLNKLFQCWSLIVSLIIDHVCYIIGNYTIQGVP